MRIVKIDAHMSHMVTLKKAKEKFQSVNKSNVRSALW